MGIQTAAVLYPRNSTVVDTPPAGGDIRFLSDTEPGANDDTQTVQWTHTQDNVGRTFDPATGGVTTVDGVGSVPLRFGYGLRKVEDLTPPDDTNCDAALTTGTLTVNIQVALNQSGGTYAGGNYTPSWRAAIWRYNPSTDVELLIEGVVTDDGSVTWDYTPVTGDLGTFKNIAMPITVDPIFSFTGANNIFVLELGLNTGTVPNPTLGTATWTATLRVDNANTNITFAAGQGIRILCEIAGTSAGVAEASGVPVVVLPQVGTASGVATVSGAMQADANMDGTSEGVGAASGALQAIGQMSGSAGGVAVVTGGQVVIIPTVGTVDIGGGGASTIVKPIYIFDD